MKTLFQQQRHFLRLNAHRLPKLFFSDQSWFSTNQNPPINYSSSSFTNAKFSIIANLLSDPTITSSSSLHSALDKTQVDPDPDMLQAIFLRFDSSPRLLHGLFLWAEKRPGFESSDTLFDSMVNVLGKSRSFEEAWSLVLDRIGDDGGREGSNLVSVNTFVILIRRYARAGMGQAAIRTFEFASSLDQICSSDEKTNLFETMLDSLCKEGHVRVASEYFTRKKQTDLCWVPSIKVYNILLNGWFRSRKLKHAERLWSDMKKNGVLPSVVTYGTLIEGYCTMRRVERAVELVDEMKEAGMELNAKVYNPIIDSLGEAGRLKEALGMMERVLSCESGPDISTYNSLVKGHCKAKDLAGASKVLKMMISRGCIPTITTYNYFFRYFSKFRKIEEAMNLYTKIVQSGHAPDRLTYQLLLKLLCEEERLDLAVQVSIEMTVKGFDRGLALSTMLVHLLCKMHRFEDAFGEFEDMIRRGIVPQYLTFERMNNELKKRGMTEMARKQCDMMRSVHSSKKLPNTYVGEEDSSRTRRTMIMRKAEAISDMLKTCNDPRELVKHRTLSGNAVSKAGQLIEIIKKRAKETSMNG